MHRLISTILLLLFASLMFAQEKDDPYAEIVQDIKKKNYKKAHFKVDQLLEKDPKDFTAFLLKADIYIGQKAIRTAKD